MEYSQNEMLRQIFDEHWQEFCDYWAARTRDVSQVETVTYDSDRHSGILMRHEWQGIRKVVAVSPESLVEGLSLLSEELRQRCISATGSAEQAALFAKSQADFAKSQGDRIDVLISEITSLKAQLKNQGDTAEEQGNAAQTQKELVEAWYSPFKDAAETWFSSIMSEVAMWFGETKEGWNSWFAARKQEWTGWFSGVSSDWSTWFGNTKTEWNSWFAARKQEWTGWFSGISSDWSSWYGNTTTEWNSWFAAKKLEWTDWFSSVRGIVESWTAKEQERQSAEEVRLEMMAHPPIPSERGYWMLWDMTVTPHAYVESGYSSRGTMDWPEFFWDYNTMGVGVVTTRDYSRFSIDEMGRFRMKM